MATTETSEEIAKRIMQQPVPAAGQLINPIANVAKSGTVKQLTVKDAKNFEFPTDVKKWTAKHFVDYFAKKYQENSGANYRRVYRSDIMIVSNMGDFLVSNGLERNSWTKKLIDWAFHNREQIIQKEGHFTLQEVLHQSNYFYQQEILPKVEDDEIQRDTENTLLLEEIKKADELGKVPEIFIRFGIPVAITYLVNIKNVNLINIMNATEMRIKAMGTGSTLQKNQLEQILQSSVIGSPYPSEFLSLNWRERFSKYIRKYEKESWWRNEDYKGKPLSKYYSLIGSAK